jgi:hypothetical protein
MLAYSDAGERAQAVLIGRGLIEADPDDAEVRAAMDAAIEIEPDLGMLVKKSALGSNLTDRRLRDDFPVAGAIALYPINRILDLIDLMTLEAGICFGLGIKAQATDYVALGAQATLQEAALGLNRRHLSVRATLDEFFELFPIQVRAFTEARASTAGAYFQPYFEAGIKQPRAAIYQRARDFWGVGLQAQAGVVSFFAQVHPIEIADFVVGFALFDLLRDDIGVSQGIRLKQTEKQDLARLARLVNARPRD